MPKAALSHDLAALPLPANWITLGPSSLDILDDLVAVGANGVRLTFSFGTPQLQASRAGLIRSAASRAGKRCLAIADLPGGKPRLGEFSGADMHDSQAGDRFTLVVQDAADPRDGILPVPNAAFLKNLEAGDVIMVGDGAASFVVVSTLAAGVVVSVVDAGRIEQTRGLIARGARFDPVSLSNKDRDDLAFIAASAAFDALAISFVSSAADVEEARALLGAAGEMLPVIAKIEHPAGVATADEIAACADAVLIGRGDLALSLDWVDLPEAVQAIVDACTRSHTPFIVGTQIAEGLERFSFPTRAEICDLAHWLNEGSAGALLSYETAFGSHPVEAVAATQRLLERWHRSSEIRR